jgi:hypothetical protein
MEGTKLQVTILMFFNEVGQVKLGRNHRKGLESLTLPKS